MTKEIQIRQRMLTTLLFASSGVGMLHEFIQSQIASILWGGFVSKYLLTVGLYILSLGAGAAISQYFPKRTESLALQQIALGFLGLLLPFVSLLIGSRYTYNIGFSVMVISVFVLGSISGMEFPLILELYEGKRQTKDDATFMKLLGLDYVAMGIVTLIGPLIVAQVFGVLVAAFLASIVNCLMAIALLALEKEVQRQSRIVLSSAAGVIVIFVVIGLGFRGDIENIFREWIVT
jgi:spermidine synthase